MNGLEAISRALGVLIRHRPGEPFRHVATAWQVAPGEWLTAALDEGKTGDELLLLIAADGRTVRPSQWETASGIAGFRADAAAATLEVAGEQRPLTKTEPLRAVGYPDVIEHPALRLSRDSLDPSRYFPWLCPWEIAGHCALFSAEEGWLSGQGYAGMQGAPVLDPDHRVIGLVTGPSLGEGTLPPLTPFRRLG